MVVSLGIAAAMFGDDDPTSGELRVGCPEITMAGLLPAIVERFFQQYPRIRLHVAMAQTAQCFSFKNAG